MSRRGRGGLGKFLRARGRRGGGMRAEFTERLVLPGEQELDEEEAEEIRKRYRKREITGNEDRYAEIQPEEGEEEEEEEPPVIVRPRSTTPIAGKDVDNDEDVDHTLSTNKKVNKHQTLEWTQELEDLRKEIDVANANRDLKARLRGKRPETDRKANMGRLEEKDDEAFLDELLG